MEKAGSADLSRCANRNGPNFPLSGERVEVPTPKTGEMLGTSGWAPDPNRPVYFVPIAQQVSKACVEGGATLGSSGSGVRYDVFWHVAIVTPVRSKRGDTLAFCFFFRSDS